MTNHQTRSAADEIARQKAKVDEEVQLLQDKLREKDKELREYKKAHGSIMSVQRAVLSAVEPIKPLPMEYRVTKGAKVVSSECAAVMRSSDGHHGACQEADEIEGFGEFSPEISEARQLGYANAVVRWVDLHRSNYHIPNLHHIVTGDMISGDIHEELRVTNAWPTPVQAIRAGEVLAKQVMITAPHFEKVIVEFICDDNHARMTRKPQAKEAGINTLNFVVGSHAMALLRDHKNVEFRLHTVHEKVIHVLTRQYLCCHGHGVRGWAGVPWYGIERKVGKESQARLQIIMEDLTRAKQIGFHKYVFGHFHTDIALELYDGCASVQGTDAYDHKEGRYGKPGQASWLVHPVRGEFDRTNWDMRSYA